MTKERGFIKSINFEIVIYWPTPVNTLPLIRMPSSPMGPSNHWSSGVSSRFLRLAPEKVLPTMAPPGLLNRPGKANHKITNETGDELTDLGLETSFAL